MDNRWKRWSAKGIFARMMEGLASQAAVSKTVMIDATSLRAKKGGLTTSAAVWSVEPRVG
jgi:transposase